METKAKYILVGACTLLAVLLLFAFVRFSRQGQTDSSERRQYAIYFHGGVSGLSVGNNVLFNGVRIGSVKDIRLSTADQSTVQVIIEVSSAAIMRQDCLATLQTQGITGLSSIYIQGGASTSPPLAQAKKDELPIIPSRQSTLEKIATDAPEAIHSISEIMRRTTEALSEENLTNLRLTLSNLAAISSKLAAQSNNLGEQLGETLHNISAASVNLNKVLASADRLLNVDLHNTGLSAKQAFDHLDKILIQAEPDLKKISSVTLDELTRFFADARQVIKDLDILVRSIQNNPSALFFGGNNTPEYRPR